MIHSDTRFRFGYMSPETVQGRPADARSDVFSLGVLLYELTTGHRPFSGPSDIDVLRGILDGAFPPPSSYVPGYPEPLAAVIAKALARQPEDRFEDTGALADAIEKALDESFLAGTREELAGLVRGLVAK